MRRLMTRRAVVLAAFCMVGLLGVAVLQARQAQTTYLKGGLFSLKASEVARFNVSLDDDPGALPGVVTLQFIDRQGNVVKQTTATIQAGKTVTLTHQGPGEFRVYAVAVDQANPSPRRTYEGAAEATDMVTGQTRPLPCDRGRGPQGVN